MTAPDALPGVVLLCAHPASGQNLLFPLPGGWDDDINRYRGYAMIRRRDSLGLLLLLELSLR